MYIKNNTNYLRYARVEIKNEIFEVFITKHNSRYYQLFRKNGKHFCYLTPNSLINAMLNINNK